MGLFGRKKKSGMGLGLADHNRSPRKSHEQDKPEQERVTRLDEKAGVAVHQMNNPPKAEG